MTKTPSPRSGPEAQLEEAAKMVESIFTEFFANTGPVQMDDDQFRAFLTKDGYEHIRKLDDGTWVGIVPLMFSVGLCMGLDRIGWDRRYCYEDRALAVAEIAKLERGDQVPQGWIAKRPQ